MQLSISRVQVKDNAIFLVIATSCVRRDWRGVCVTTSFSPDLFSIAAWYGIQRLHYIFLSFLFARKAFV